MPLIGFNPSQYKSGLSIRETATPTIPPEVIEALEITERVREGLSPLGQQQVDDAVHCSFRMTLASDAERIGRLKRERNQIHAKGKHRFDECDANERQGRLRRFALHRESNYQSLWDRAGGMEAEVVCRFIINAHALHHLSVQFPQASDLELRSILHGPLLTSVLSSIDQSAMDAKSWSNIKWAKTAKLWVKPMSHLEYREMAATWFNELHSYEKASGKPKRFSQLKKERKDRIAVSVLRHEATNYAWLYQRALGRPEEIACWSIANARISQEMMGQFPLLRPAIMNYMAFRQSNRDTDNAEQINRDNEEAA